jgi:hypothetical protein
MLLTVRKKCGMSACSLKQTLAEKEADMAAKEGLKLLLLAVSATDYLLTCFNVGMRLSKGLD